RVASGMLRDPGTEHGLPDGALEDGFVQVVPSPLPALAIEVDPRGGEHPLPAPFAAGVRILPAERMRERHPARVGGEVALVSVAPGFDQPLERVLQRTGQHRAPIPTALAGTHDDLVAGEIDVLHPEAKA